MKNTSKLLFENFDHSIKKLTINKKKNNRIIEFVTFTPDNKTKVKYIFNDVISIEFSSNLFDEPFGAEVHGIYEISSKKAKKDILESNFQKRKIGYLQNGDYDYDKNDDNDILNYRCDINKIIEKIDAYNLYQINSTGGVYYIICKDVDKIQK